MRRLMSLMLVILLCRSISAKGIFYAVAQKDNDIVILLEKEGYTVIFYKNQEEALEKTPRNGPLLLLSPSYPRKYEYLTPKDMQLVKRRHLRVYAEYCPTKGNDTGGMRPRHLSLERVVVTDSDFNERLPNMALLSINRSYVLPVKGISKPFLVVAKVAGFDKAEYGLENTESYPLLYKCNSQILVATSSLSRFAIARFMPENRWKLVWESVLSFLTGRPFHFDFWLSYVHPQYGEKEALPLNARRNSVMKGIEWFYKGHFLIDPSWGGKWIGKYMGDGTMPIGPSLPERLKNGNGSDGILEGHCSSIDYDGRQMYRYWLRADVHGETSMAFSLAGRLFHNHKLSQVASNINNYAFDFFRKGSNNDPKSPSFGLISWSVTSPGNYYGDDNARFLLGAMASAAVLKDNSWNEKISEAIIGNFRTTGKNGFRSDMLQDSTIQRLGWQHFYNDTISNPHPHFEAWPWACYLYLYSKTRYLPLLRRTERGIRLTMEAYKRGGWKWTNGIQQERARMLLPLAWLVRVSPTETHLQWLRFMADELIKNQQPCGAIREELGDPSKGCFGRTKSNADYGKQEAPLIFTNGDPIADMLYTNNFAFIGLNETARATGDPKYLKAVNKLSSFLIRIQVKSTHLKSVDGAWFRAFNYLNWDYWASNADAGWGAWSTLTGWIQSWIITTQILLEMKTSLWDVIGPLPLENCWPVVKGKMLN